MVGYGYSQSYLNKNIVKKDPSPRKVNCDVKARTEVQLPDTPATPVVNPNLTDAFIKVPLVLAETTLQVVVEADIPLDPPASEIKRVLKDVFLTQCKLVPVGPFEEINESGFYTSEGAKLFVEGYIRKNIEYAPKGCNSALRTLTAKVPFSGFADLTGEGDLNNFPIFGFGDQRRAQFLDPKHGESPRLDKYFFQNSVIYNEQPFCELISAEFFELDFSPHSFDSHESKHSNSGSFNKLREKIVTDLTLKVLQVQQIPLTVNGSVAKHGHEEDC
ncbi:CsxC family protein [Oceanobacillus saliphilus]|uniref:CsxC family protein n=1 Tax=Oceanobacillus saliphilus TaxID=2925834 RepID=UPI00201DD774|nr:Uracil permease [Oceanobacillus saliphilus]